MTPATSHLFKRLSVVECGFHHICHLGILKWWIRALKAFIFRNYHTNSIIIWETPWNDQTSQYSGCIPGKFALQQLNVYIMKLINTFLYTKPTHFPTSLVISLIAVMFIVPVPYFQPPTLVLQITPNFINTFDYSRFINFPTSVVISLIYSYFHRSSSTLPGPSLPISFCTQFCASLSIACHSHIPSSLSLPSPPPHYTVHHSSTIVGVFTSVLNLTLIAFIPTS